MLDFKAAVTAYRNLREARADLKRRYELEDDALKDKLERLEAHMLAGLVSTNQMRASTAAGTVFRQVDFIPRVDDWEAFYEHIRSTGNFDLIERRVGKNAVKRFMDTHSDMTPPGVSVMREWKVGVRKPTDKVGNE